VEFGMHNAKTNLSDLVARALDGEEIVITRRGVPAVKLVPADQPKPGFAGLFGVMKGQITMSDDFDELGAELTEAFELESDT
jgi:prevent-host-death family protein